MEGKSYDERIMWLKRRLQRTQMAVFLALCAAPVSAALARWWPRSEVVARRFVLEDSEGRSRGQWDASQPAALVELPLPDDGRPRPGE